MHERASNAVDCKNARQATIGRYGVLNLASERAGAKRNLISQLESSHLSKDKLNGRLNGSLPEGVFFSHLNVRSDALES